MFRKTAPSNTIVHISFAFAALLGVVIISSGQTLRGTQADIVGTTNGPVVEIGVEHNNPASLSLELSTLGTKGIADISHDGTETIFVSVPSDWKKREVRNAPLQSVSSDPPSLGFTRWTLPPNAAISFAIETAPRSILLHNPSSTPLKVSLAKVNLDTNEVLKDIILVQKASVHLW